jgi:hypothetical protein
MKNPVCILLLGSVLISASVNASDYPQRKAGLWRMTMMSEQIGGQGITAEHCVDSKTDKAMQASSMQGPDVECGEQTTKKTADGWSYRVVCKFQQSTATTDGTITGDFVTRYELNNVTRFEPALMGVTEEKMRMTADYQGACPADMKPGDIRMNGMTMNIADKGKPQLQIEGLPDMKPEEMRKMVEELQKKMQ